jgi:hypothetical protein
VPRRQFVKQDNDNTAAVASIKDVADCAARADAQVRSVLRRVMAQRRSAAVASGYVAGLSPGTRANCCRSRNLLVMRGGAGCRRCSARTGGTGGCCARLPGLAAA